MTVSMGKLVLTEEEKILAARAQDLIRKCDSDNCPVFSDFLSDREKEIVLCKARELGAAGSVITFGGFPDAERTMAGFFPDYCLYMEKEELLDEFPIVMLEIKCSGFREHNHRDFLGSVLGLGLERFVVGDIIVGENGCNAFVFVHERIADFLVENLKLVGRDGVKVAVCPQSCVTDIKVKTEQINGTAASLRADALISEVLNLSRDKTVKLIEAGLVTVDHAPVTEKSTEIGQGSIFTVRGYGKYRLSGVGDRNRKDRIRFTVEKYV